MALKLSEKWPTFRGFLPLKVLIFGPRLLSEEKLLILTGTYLHFAMR